MEKRIGYLCSEYPAISHTFIAREIDIIEQEGFKVIAASINQTKNLEKLSEKDRKRAEHTYFIKKTKKNKIAGLLLIYALTKPKKFIDSLIYNYNLTKKNGPKNIKKTIGYFVEAVLLHSWAKRNSIKHIHVHFANPAATVALVAAKFGGIEYSLSVHGPDEFYNINENNVREKIEGAKFVRCISYYCQSQLMRLSNPLNWSKFHIVRCGVNPEQFIANKTKKEKDYKNIVCVGRLTPSKGQLILLEASKILTEQKIKHKVTLIGGGEDYNLIKEKITEYGMEKNIIMTGPIGQDEVLAALKECDIFVLPSFAEGIPVALMEAMAMEIPVVTTAITGIPELIQNGKDGFLVEPSNKEQLAEVIKWIIENNDKMEKISVAARMKVKEKYDVEKNTKILADIFKKNI